MLRAQVKHHLGVLVRHHIGILRGLGRAKGSEGDHGIDGRHHADSHRITPAPADGVGIAVVQRRAGLFGHRPHRQNGPGLPLQAARGRVLRTQPLAQPGRPARQRHVDHAERAGQAVGVGHEMPAARAQADGVIQDDALIDEHRRGEAGQQPHQTAVTLQHAGHPQQEQRREQVALVHLHAEDVQEDEQHRAAQGQHAHLSSADEDGQHHREGQRHRHRAQAHPGGIEHQHKGEGQREEQHQRRLHKAQADALLHIALQAHAQQHGHGSRSRQQQHAGDDQRGGRNHTSPGVLDAGDVFADELVHRLVEGSLGDAHAVAQLVHIPGVAGGQNQTVTAHDSQRQRSQAQYQHDAQGGLQQSQPAIPAADKGHGAPGSAEHHEDRRHRLAGRVQDGIPVSAEEVVQVGGVDGRIGIGGQGLAVELKEPREAALADGCRQDDDKRRCQAQHQAKAHLPPDFGKIQLAGGIAGGLIAQERHDDRRQAQEAQHQRLGLHQHRRHIHRQHRRPVAADGQVRHQHQHQAQHAVHLAPGCAIDDDGGVKGQQHRRHDGSAPLQLFLSGDMVDQNRRRQVAEDGHQLMQEGDHHHIAAHGLGKGLAAVEELVDKAVGRINLQQVLHQPVAQAKDVEVARRIVAEASRLIEAAGACRQEGIAPGDEAAHVHLIAHHIQRKEQAQHRSRNEHRREQLFRAGRHAPEGHRRFLLQGAFGLHGCQPAAGDEGAQRIHAGDHQEPGPEGLFRLCDLLRLAEKRNGRRLAVPLFQADSRRNVRRLLQAEVVKGGAALGEVIVAVAAHAGEDGHAGLLRAGAAVHLHQLPVARAVVDALAVHMQPFNGEVRATPAVRYVQRLHIAGKAVERIRLHADVLGKARIIHGQVVHHGGHAGAALRQHTVRGHRAIVVPGLGVPA